MDPTRPEGVMRVAYGGQGVVQREDGERLPCRFRRSVGRPCCGDRVRLERAGADDWVVAEILPRRNEFVRGDGRQRRQVIACNLDQVLVVIAPEPRPSRDLVERYLVAVHSLGMQPVLVINKAELLDASAGLTDTAQSPPFSRVAEYRRLGYTVVHTSTRAAPGTDALAPLLHGSTSILVGQSGVGKSSLVNRLIPDLDLQTGELSRATGKGTHTTTTTILYELPDGGALIDSPGVWEYGLWAMSARELAAGFPEFWPYVGQCRFNDCRHHGEPGCAVDAAMGEGAIPEWRLSAYRRLLEQA
ncbi:ribosome small subunit-dependent GTPase A [Elongatibacter sediminis]